ncbi:uncharacterized protein EURHEDRAFT_61756 [Aspergillus ruber CBS 135680]|uniref:Uncharacterized protein n=1 Tax=Aspergillus ruber (strain CBS 135680) TaxID=1388766 RepID=A0A017SFN5_ASPRC|nr:uncharacterized protein EURHEDRAFT_61756 [Aspergillus ruber CBS 135680]EYE95055.1 hypothetical protein EURHEDRAFT_61756 [Aspergillus ruber CBS 135680]
MHRRAFISLIFNTPSAHASTFITNSILYSTSKHALPFCHHSRKQLCRKEGCASLSQILAGLTIRTKLAHSRHSRSLAKKSTRRGAKNRPEQKELSVFHWKCSGILLAANGFY